MRDYSTDHCGFQSETPVERDERLATLAGRMSTPDAGFGETVAEIEFVAHETFLNDDAMRHLRTL